MHLSNYLTLENDTVTFSEDQASGFAKGVAGDFNPLHDPGSKRFCVPGDLLFSVLLNHYGMAQTTGVQFSGMLDGKTYMHLPEIDITADTHTPFVDAKGKSLLSLFLQGKRNANKPFIDAVCLQYVKFSGRTFPDILVPLMRDALVMINPDRPLVIYKDMSIEFNDQALALLDHSPEGKPLTQLKGPLGELELALANSEISVNGRKGAVRLQFVITVDGVAIGSGVKNMVLSGLRDYDETAMQAIVDQYVQWRESYQGRSYAV